jgi:hypothetical protein
MPVPHSPIRTTGSLRSIQFCNTVGRSPVRVIRWGVSVNRSLARQWRDREPLSILLYICRKIELGRVGLRVVSRVWGLRIWLSRGTRGVGTREEKLGGYGKLQISDRITQQSVSPAWHYDRSRSHRAGSRYVMNAVSIEWRRAERWVTLIGEGRQSVPGKIAVANSVISLDSCVDLSRTQRL